MSQIKTILIILIPLFIGFFIPVRGIYWQQLSSRMINVLVYAILLFIGMSLALLPNPEKQLFKILAYASIFLIGTLGVNIIIMILLDYCLSRHRRHTAQTAHGWSALSGSLKQISILVIGVIIGWRLPEQYHLPEDTVLWLLIVLLILIGVQLRGSGISLRQVLFNRQGVILAVTFMFATYLGGMIAGLLSGIPIMQSLAISSGFGWYTLSGPMITKSYGVFWGTVAFFNDLGREIFAFIAIPLLMKYYPSAGITIGGATAMDFTLPVIMQSGGQRSASLAISFSFLINMLIPILIAFFSSF